MRNLLLLTVLVLGGCSATGLDPNTCEPIRYPHENSAEGYPVCHWLLDEYGCETFEDYNSDGQSDIQDLYDFCQRERDGDSLTTDVDNVLEDWSTPRVVCYTCD